MADSIFSFAWDKKKPDWLGQDVGGMKLDATNTQQVPNVSFGQSSGSMMTAQELGGGDIPTTPMQQSNAGVLDDGGFDLAGLADSLASGAGGDDFKFNKPNMTAMTVGGGGQGYQSMAAQPVQPLSTAMGAITSPQQQMYGAQQQPQDINMMRRMLGLA